VLTSFVPGQEKGNAEFVTGSGAGVYAPRPRQLAAEIGRLRCDPGALASMRAAAVRVSRPRAAADIARFLATLSGFTGQAAADAADAADAAGATGVPGVAGPSGSSGAPGGQDARDLLPTLIAD
jgi:hypothetical protein